MECHQVAPIKFASDTKLGGGPGQGCCSEGHQEAGGVGWQELYEI